MHARMRDFIIHWIATPSVMARNDKRECVSGGVPGDRMGTRS